MIDELLKYVNAAMGVIGIWFMRATYKIQKQAQQNTNPEYQKNHFSNRKNFLIFTVQILIWLLMLASNGYVFWELSESTEPLTRSDVVDMVLAASWSVISLFMLMLVPTFYYVLRSTDQLRENQLATVKNQQELIDELSAAMGIAKNRQPEKIEKK